MGRRKREIFSARYSEECSERGKNMGIQKKFFAALRYIVPSEMETYLEEMSANGQILRPVGESGLFYFELIEEKPQKTRFIVDHSGMSKVAYMQTAVDSGWDYMGKSFNCEIWRKNYEDSNRPPAFTDQEGVQKHCLRQGLVMAAMALVCLALAVAIVYFMREERLQGISAHTVQYAIMLITQLPFILYFAWAGRKLLAEAAHLKEVIARGAIRKRASVISESEDE